MPFDHATYTPGDPWETREHFARAFAAPRISEVLSAAGETTTPSYFEYRQACEGNTRTFALSIQYETGSGTFEAVLERSNDDGSTWAPVETFTTLASTNVDCQNHLAMYRVRVVAIAGGTTIRVSLVQFL